MKPLLLFSDYSWQRSELQMPLRQILASDLELQVLVEAMGGDDTLVVEVCREVILDSLTEPEAIIYRQNVLCDCLENAALIRKIYRTISQALQDKDDHYYIIAHGQPNAILHSAMEIIQLFSKTLKEVRRLFNQGEKRFRSSALQRLTGVLQEELNEQFFHDLKLYCKELNFKDGVLFNCHLGPGNRGIDYTLCRHDHDWHSLTGRAFNHKMAGYSFQIGDNDESGARALSELKYRGLNSVADTMARTSEHIVRFLQRLRQEMAFYIGAVNLHDKLLVKGIKVSFPQPVTAELRRYNFVNLYDPVLTLTAEEKTVPNTLKADNIAQVIITGANQGGKSTFLRSIGLAQLMMQAGLFVPAETFTANICSQIFTHYCKEEDSRMNSGKLDEELQRMNEIVNAMSPHALLLLNESFAATNEREGSEIARQIMTAMRERSPKIFFVTHLYDFANHYYRCYYDNVLFLRAVREDDGNRTFKIIPGEPLQTSYGDDLYNRIFTTI